MKIAQFVISMGTAILLLAGQGAAASAAEPLTGLGGANMGMSEDDFSKLGIGEKG